MKFSKLMRTLLALILAFTTICVLASCAASENTPPADDSETKPPVDSSKPDTDVPEDEVEDDGIVLGYVAQSMSNSFHIALTEALAAYCDELGIDCTILSAEDILLLPGHLQ